MGSARAPRGSPSHSETGHSTTACRARRVRGLRGKSGLAPLQPTARSPLPARVQGRAAFPAGGATGTLLRP